MVSSQRSASALPTASRNACRLTPTGISVVSVGNVAWAGVVLLVPLEENARIAKISPVV